ncbi:hypothetical protein Tco_0535158 [Tanacetum coccineum]
MESQSETTQTVSALKLPVLKTGEYDLWSMRMEKYITFTDHALLEVIVNGDSVSPVASASTVAEAIPDEHLLKFHACKDAKSLWEAIKNSQEGLDKTYDRFQKLISQLEIHGEVISHEDANIKLLRSLPSAWNNIALIMRNKSDLDKLNMDDLYNNLKVTNEIVNTAHSVSAASSKDQASTASYADDIDADDLKEMDLKWQVAMLTRRVKRAPRIQGNRNRDDPSRNATMDTSTTNVLVIQDGIDGYDWSFQTEEGIANFALNAYTSQGSSSSSSSSSSDSEVHNCSKDGLKSYETLQKQYDQQCEALNKSNLEVIGYQMGIESLEARISELNNIHMNESEVVHSVFNSRESNVDDSLVNDRFKTGEGFHAVPLPYTENYMPPRPDLSFAGLDESIFQSIVRKTTTSVPETETSISKTSKDIVEKPKTVRPSAPIIEE